MTTWNYRVVAYYPPAVLDLCEKTGRCPEPLYDLTEVYYEDETPVSWAPDFNVLSKRESVEDLKDDLLRFKTALSKHTLWWDESTRELTHYRYYTGPGSFLDKITGCLLGCALGDAIGSPVEKHPLTEVAKYVEDHVQTMNFQGVSRKNHRTGEYYAFGQVTDDTQCMRMLAMSMQKEEVDIDLFAQLLVNYHNTDGLVGYGCNTLGAIERLASGESPVLSGNRTSAGNGAAMRAAILGVYTDPILAVLTSSKVTHASEEALLGALMVALMAQQCFYYPNTPEEMFSKALGKFRIKRALEPFSDLEMFQDYIQLQTLLKENNLSTTEKRTCVIRDFVLALQPPDSEWEGVSPYVRPSVLWALYCFLEHPKDFIKMTSLAVSIGGDVDTIAAISGALYGCLNGAVAFKSSWLDAIHDREGWKEARYRQLGVHVCDVLFGDINVLSQDEG